MSYCRNDGECEICDITPEHCPDCYEPADDLCVCDDEPDCRD